MPVGLVPITDEDVANYSAVLGAENRIHGTGRLVCYPVTDVQVAITRAAAQLAAARINGSGSGVSGTAADIVDGSNSTTATINAHVAGAASNAIDWFEVDLGVPYGVKSVSVKVTVGAGQTLKVWLADAPELAPGDAGTVLLGSVATSVATLVLNASPVANGRFLLIESIKSTAASLTIAEVTASVYPGIAFALVQSWDLKATPKREYLYASPQEQVYAVDCADAEVAIDMKLVNAEVDTNALQLVTAAAIRTAASADIATAHPGYTGGDRTEVSVVDGPIELPRMTFEYKFVTRSGKNVDVLLTSVKPKGFDFPFARANYMLPSLDMNCYEDSKGKAIYYTTDNA